MKKLIIFLFITLLFTVGCSRPGKNEFICCSKKYIQYFKSDEYKELQKILQGKGDENIKLKMYTNKSEEKQLEIIKSCGFKGTKEYNEVYLEYYDDPEVKEWLVKQQDAAIQSGNK